MTDELFIEGKQYISSKRAADLSGYAQDYVGQLARKGFIDAQRIGGLWYVFMDSLLAYKQKAESYVPQPPQVTYKNESPDTLISFDGKDYVSAARAAEITGYHQDYVGQLARSGKILSRQVGNRWYVDREGILSHKEEKDDLLGAVQAQAVGIKPLEPRETAYEQKIESWEPLKYETDTGALIPSLSSREIDQESEPEHTEDSAGKVPVPIRVMENRQSRSFVTKYDVKKNTNKKHKIPGKSIFYAVSLVIVLSISATVAFKMFAHSPNKQTSLIVGDTSPEQQIEQGTITVIIRTLGDVIEPFVSKQLDFTRN